MPKFQLTSPDGKKYEVEGPEGSTPEQAYGILQQQLGDQAKAGNTRGGDLARGLAHGAMSSVGLGAYGPAEDPNPSGWRETGETVGGMAPPIAAGLIPGGPVLKTAIGTGVGALQPAKDWNERARNALVGAGSAWGAGKVAAMPQGVKTGLDRLAEMGIGSMVGRHFGEWGPLGGVFAGRAIGREVERITGGRGLGDLVAWLAKNPGLAASMGVKLTPAAEQAGSFVGQELGKPSQ